MLLSIPKKSFLGRKEYFSYILEAYNSGLAVLSAWSLEEAGQVERERRSYHMASQAAERSKADLLI